MINLFLNEIDSVPFFLKKEVITCVDTIPENEFSSYQFLQLDSLKVFYDVDAIDTHILSSGMEGLVRPFMQQFGSVIFLVFTLIFVLFALVFRSNGRALFSNFGNIFSVGSRNKSFYSDQITTSDIWTKVFFVLQTFTIFSILFLDIAIDYTSQSFHGLDYILLFSQIFGVIFLFTFSKYLFYQFVSVVFSDSKTSALIEIYLWIIYLTGVLSFIPIVLYFYIHEVRLYVLFFLFAVFITGRIIVFIKSYSFFVKSHIGILYFFVYLCALEIMPYLLLYKAIISIS